MENKRKPLNLPKVDNNYWDEEGNLHTVPPMTEEEWKERLDKGESDSEEEKED